MYPMKLNPCGKDYLWGGSRLRELFGKACAETPLAETWELACHPDGQSVIAEGEARGKTLTEIYTSIGPKLLGDKYRGDGTFPILVKFIDAAQDLSVQVHPSDETALEGECGKAEMWYVVDCAPQAYIYYGFNRKLTCAEVLERARDGTICDVLNRVPVQRGDVFYILPGTVHAIGRGLVVAEIQQNSNTTFRLYDYQRPGTDGRLRPLHLERAAQVMDCTPSLPREARSNNSAHWERFSLSEMFSCQYFSAYRAHIHGSASFFCALSSFHHLLCVGGTGVLHWRGKQYPVRSGDSYFLPAGLGEYRIDGHCDLLLSTL